MHPWAKRIKIRMKELGLTQEVLANKMDMTRANITHYVNGRRVPPLSQFEKLATLLKVDPAWLQFGTPSLAENIEKEKTTPKKLIPILSWEQVAKSTDENKTTEKEIQEYVPHFYTDQSRWFALRVQSDSMTAASNKEKSFREDDIIIVDPDGAVKNGSYVVAKLPQAKEAIFRQYVVDGGVGYLRALNTQYAMVKMEDGVKICGVVVGCWN